MKNLLEYFKRFVRREPVMIRAAAGFLAALAVSRFHLDPAAETGIGAGIVAGAALWARAKVTPVRAPRVDLHCTTHYSPTGPPPDSRTWTPHAR